MNQPIEPELRVLSLGAGVQSTTMALMAAHGEFKHMPDCAIFADTGWEPAAVYDHLQWLMSPNVLPFPVHVISRGNLRDDLLTKATGKVDKRFAAVPFFTSGGGLGRRQCTKEYKVEPIARKQRELLGYVKGQRIPAGSCEVWIGISTDEAVRMKPSRYRWQANRWPLIEKRMSRWDCLRWLERRGYPAPPKSSCLGCPFHSDAHWRAMRDNAPDEWADTVRVDKEIRAGGTLTGMREQQFMHRSLVPLDEVDLSTAAERGQPDLFANECEGMCGV